VKRFADQTLYEILEVGADAPATDIERAYERVRALYGPGSLATYTLMSPEDAALLTTRIEEARSVLLDPAARQRYDASLGAPRPAAAPANGARPEGPNGASTVAPWSDARALPPVIPALAPPRANPETSAGERGAPASEAAPAPAASVAASAPPAPSVQVAAEPVGAPLEPPPPPPERERSEPAAVPPEPAREPLAAAGDPAAAQPPGAPAILLSQTAAAAPAAPSPRPPIRLERQVGTPAAAAAGPRDLLIPDGAAWSGDILRRVREARGISISQISERTKVTRHHIENIEGERFGLLPAPVYLRGILLALARELRLDGQKVASSYLDRLGGGSAPPGPKR